MQSSSHVQPLHGKHRQAGYSPLDFEDRMPFLTIPHRIYLNNFRAHQIIYMPLTEHAMDGSQIICTTDGFNAYKGEPNFTHAPTVWQRRKQGDVKDERKWWFLEALERRGIRTEELPEGSGIAAPGSVRTSFTLIFKTAGRLPKSRMKPAPDAEKGEGIRYVPGQSYGDQ